MTTAKDRYRQLEVVAEGGQGRLVKAVDERHDRTVALKVRRMPASEAERQAVLAEARTLFSITPHPLLPTLRDDYFDGDDYVLVMDWVEGQSLAHVVAERGDPGMPVRTVMPWVDDLAAALEHLHRQDPPIVHGDVKPANAVLTDTGRVVLVDLGLAGTGADQPAEGTVGYQAPELQTGAVPSPRSDVYSLAATTLALLTGQPPGATRPPWPGVEPTAVTVIEHALRTGLALDPSRRPAGPSELANRIHGWSSQAAAPQPPDPSDQGARGRPWRNRAMVITVVGCVGLAAAGAAWIAIPRSGQSQDVVRYQGADRYASVAAASSSLGHAAQVVIARGDELTDAEAACYIAGAHTASPILLSAPTGLTPTTVKAVESLGAKNALIIGDTTAVPASVDTQLANVGVADTRLAAPTRYGTAAVVSQAGGPPASLPGLGPTAIIVDANDPDSAAVAAPLCYHNRYPLLYANGPALPPETTSAIKEAGITHVIVVQRSSDQIGDPMTTQLTALGVTSTVISGAGPDGVAAALADYETTQLNWHSNQVDIARGDQTSDAIAATPSAAIHTAPLLLADTPKALGPATDVYLSGHATLVTRLQIYGDSTAISDQAARAAQRLLRLP